MQSRREARYRRASLNSLILSSLFVACLSILFTSADLARKSHPATANAAERARIALSTGWTYAADTAHRGPGDLPTAPADGWADFDPLHAWKFSNALNASGPDAGHRIWFKNTFESRLGFQSPGIMLGKIGGAHKVYLNGVLIGSADESELQPFYSFESSLLKFGEPNTLLVSAALRPSETPGISAPSGQALFVGNFEDVRAEAMRLQWTESATGATFLASALALAFGILGFAVFRRAHRHFFYAALVALTLPLSLASHNSWVEMHLDWKYVELLRNVGLLVIPAALASGCLHLRRRYLAEAIHNLAILVSVGVFSAAILTAKSHFEAMNRLEIALAIAAGYVFASSLVMLASTARDLKGRSRSRHSQSPVYETFFFSFSAVTGLAILGTLFPTDWTHQALSSWHGLSPFVFGSLLLISSSLDRAISGKRVALKESRNELVSGLIRLIHDSPDMTDAVVAIQTRVSKFLKARRSTLYLMDAQEGSQSQGRTLKATYVHGSEKVRQDVRKSLDSKAGIIGYACQHRAPLFIENIDQDSRFSEIAKAAPAEYRTRSCMIFPLVSGQQLLGVLTFADKKGDLPFTREDFAIALEVSNDLAVLLGNQELQSTLKGRLKSS